MIGRFALVLHSHLPWLRGHGRWPVGEEWLNQAIASSYVPVVDTLRRLADAGGRSLVTVGVTPVLAAQLDDPYCLDGARSWIADWLWRTQELDDPVASRREAAAAQDTLAALEGRYRAGFSPALRDLADAGVIELLSGPASHPFQPLLDERAAAFALRTGLDEHTIRFGAPAAGIWAPECGYRPGLEDLYQRVGIGHFLKDGPMMLHVGDPPTAPGRSGTRRDRVRAATSRSPTACAVAAQGISGPSRVPATSTWSMPTASHSGG